MGNVMEYLVLSMLSYVDLSDIVPEHGEIALGRAEKKWTFNNSETQFKQFPNKRVVGYK